MNTKPSITILFDRFINFNILLSLNLVNQRFCLPKSKQSQEQCNDTIKSKIWELFLLGRFYNLVYLKNWEFYYHEKLIWQTIRFFWWSHASFPPVPARKPQQLQNFQKRVQALHPQIQEGKKNQQKKLLTQRPSPQPHPRTLKHLKLLTFSVLICHRLCQRYRTPWRIPQAQQTFESHQWAGAFFWSLLKKPSKILCLYTRTALYHLTQHGHNLCDLHLLYGNSHLHRLL